MTSDGSDHASIEVHGRVTLVYNDAGDGHGVRSTATLASADDDWLVVYVDHAADRVDATHPVALVVDAHTFECAVEDVREHWVRFARPEQIDVRDARRVRRVPTNRIPGQLHLAEHDHHPHVYVEDLSTRGARLLAEADERFRVDDHIGVTIDGNAGTATIRRIVHPEGSNLCHLGLEFDTTSPELMSYLVRTVGAARADAKRRGALL